MIDLLFGHAIVICSSCLALRDRDSLVGRLAIFTLSLCCNSNSPVLTGGIVVCLLLMVDDTYG